MQSSEHVISVHRSRASLGSVVGVVPGVVVVDAEVVGVVVVDAVVLSVVVVEAEVVSVVVVCEDVGVVVVGDVLGTKSQQVYSIIMPRSAPPQKLSASSSGKSTSKEGTKVHSDRPRQKLA